MAISIVLLCVYCFFQIRSLIATEVLVEVNGTYWGSANKYSVSISAPDFWRTDTQLNITVRVTLAEKRTEPFEVKAYIESSNWALLRDDADFSWTGWSSYYTYYDEHPWTSARYSIVLAEEGDFYENTIELRPQWNIELPRGKSVTAKLDFSLLMEEIPANETDPSVVPVIERNLIRITGGDLLPPMTITLFRPLLSTVEAIAGVGVAAISGLLIAITFIFRERMLSLLHAFSSFFDRHSFLTKIGCSAIIVALWSSFLPLYFFLSEAFSQIPFVAILLEGGFVVACIILSVGLFEFIQRDWSLMQTGLGFIIAMLLVYIAYLIIMCA